MACRKSGSHGYVYTMNKKLLAIACSWGALLLSSCMDTSVVESDMSGIPSQGITYYDGTIYEYLENGDHSLGVTYDSLLYLLDCSVEESSVPLKFQELKTCFIIKIFKDKASQIRQIIRASKCSLYHSVLINRNT